MSKPDRKCKNMSLTVYRRVLKDKANQKTRDAVADVIGDGSKWVEVTALIPKEENCVASFFDVMSMGAKLGLPTAMVVITGLHK